MSVTTKELEELDRKVGRIHTIDDWRRVGEKSVQTPEELTDDDVVILAAFGGPERAAEARARQVKALNPSTPPTGVSNPATYVTRQALHKTLKGFAEDAIGGIVETVKRAIESPRIDGRFAALEARLAALEAKPSVKFLGVWDRSKSYMSGDAATHGGSLWICLADTTGEPGKDYASWKLAVKRGQA